MKNVTTFTLCKININYQFINITLPVKNKLHPA